MSSALQQLVLTCLLVFAFLATGASAGVYVIRPSAGSTCRGSEECQIQWLDDGTSPLLSSVGLCTVGLYFGEQKLVQPLGEVDVSGRRSFTFTVNPKAGPNSDKYYIALVSQAQSTNGTNSTAWSPFFRLTNMEGSFDLPLPSSAFSLTTPAISSAPTKAPGTASPSLASQSITSSIPIASSTATLESSVTSSPASAAIPSSSVTSSTPISTPQTSLSSSHSDTQTAPTTLSIPPTFTSADVVPEASRFVTSTFSSIPSDQTGTSANASTNGACKASLGGSLSSLLAAVATLSLLTSLL